MFFLNSKKQFKLFLSLKSKIILLTSLIMIVSSLMMSYIFYNNMYDHTITLLQSEGLGIAKAAALMIDGDNFEALSNSLDTNDLFYKETRSKLQNLNISIGNGMLYAIASMDTDNYTYILDGSDANMDLGFKQQKSDFSNEATQAFETGEAYTSEPYYVETFDKYYLSAFVPILNSSNQVVGIVEYDFENSEFTEKTRSLTLIIITIAILFILGSMVINFLILKRMFMPIDSLVKSITHISEGDLTLDIDTSRKDEIGNINVALSQTVASLRTMIQKISISSKKVTSASESILLSSTDATSAYEELATSTSEISSISNHQATETQNIKNVLDKLDKDLQNIFTQINYTNALASQTLDNTSNGVVVVKNTQKQIITIEESINYAHSVIQDLAKNTGKIQGIVTTISGIANQTNLLALNAAIEAARAGESGRGFAVVADEVRKLAVASNNAANEIVNIIGYINSQTNTVSEAISTSVTMTKEGKQYTDDVHSTFEIIQGSNTETQSKIADIKNSASEIVSSITFINENMNEIDKVSKIIDSNSMNLAAVTEEQMATSEEFKAMAELLSAEAELLNDSITSFKL